MEQIWIPFTQEYFVSYLINVSTIVMEEIFKRSIYFQFAAIISPEKKGKVLHLKETKSP